MFKRKYIFETKSTRISRYFRNFFFGMFICSIIYICFGITLLIIAKNENEKAAQAFFNRTPDLIVVFTGDSGRIPFAIKTAKKHKQSNVFITGVYSKNSVETLLRPYKISGEIDPNQLVIDYIAKNTVENVISTLRYLRTNKSNKNILIISHDYHIPRIRHITNKFLLDSDEYNLYYSSVKSNLTSLKGTKIVLKEVYKYIRTLAFLTLWD